VEQLRQLPLRTRRTKDEEEAAQVSPRPPQMQLLPSPCQGEANDCRWYVSQAEIADAAAAKANNICSNTFTKRRKRKKTVVTMKGMRRSCLTAQVSTKLANSFRDRRRHLSSSCTSCRSWLMSLPPSSKSSSQPPTELPPPPFESQAPQRQQRRRRWRRRNGSSTGSSSSARSATKSAAAGAVFLLQLLLTVNVSLANPLVSDLLTYKTCMNSPPSFSPGCMADVTVNIGERATFNCQVDPQCLIQYIHWYHESAETGVKRLLKTGRNATEPYVHVINTVLQQDFGRYYCVIKNVVGKSECSAFLAIKNTASLTAAALPPAAAAIMPAMMMVAFFLPSAAAAAGLSMHDDVQASLPSSSLAALIITLTALCRCYQ